MKHNSEHTAGPWDVMEGKTLLHVETANLGDGSPCGMPVCSIPKKRMADAILISAAPDLLAALEACVEALAFIETRMNTKVNLPTLQQARAAITKALGN